MKYQINLFRTALMFYTRIPVGNIKGYTNDMSARAIAYFPLVGGIIGVLCAVVYFGFEQLLPTNISVLLSMGFSFYLTGAFHEDGFADFCDGFGGGYTKERKMEIMKDSRIGTYGTVGLLALLAVKFFALNELDPMQIVYVLVGGHILSRTVTAVFAFTSSYVQSVENSKVKTKLGTKKVAGIIFPLVVGITPVIWLSYMPIACYLVVLLPVFVIFRSYVTRKIGGYTGDVLGAFQQIAEVVFYLIFTIDNILLYQIINK